VFRHTADATDHDFKDASITCVGPTLIAYPGA